MSHLSKNIISAAVLLAAAGLTTPASAQATRTWVSGVGDDANPCSRTAPCKTFAGAISKTAAGGEINCLDQGAYGTVTITKSIALVCEGVTAGVLHSATNGIIINAAATDVVFLKGLDINGAPPSAPGLNGVRFLAGGSLTIENCLIRNSKGAAPDGIGVVISNTSGNAVVQIRNTVINNHGTASSGGGVQLSPGGTGTVRALLENVTVSGNFNGVRLDSSGTTGPAGVTVAIENSSIDANTNGLVLNGPTTPAVAMLTNSSVTSNTGIGILASGAAARARVGTTTITTNGTGLAFGGGAIVNTYGNNNLNGNTSDGAFTAPPIAVQ